MNLTKASALAEIISSVAILITLAYLVLETHQNTVAIQGTIRQAMLAEDRELLLKRIDYPFLSIETRDVAGLNDNEKIQVSNWLIAFTRTRENHWLQYQNGVIDEATWSSYLAPYVNVMSMEPSRAWWRVRVARRAYDQGFIDYIDGILAETPIRPVQSISEDTGFE